jgi:predicted aconitase with swiveling domain
MTTSTFCTGTTIVHGSGSGTLLSSELELNFWGGVNSQSGEIVYRHHPLSGQHLKGTILAIPCGRGSCSGSGVILELLLNGDGPRDLVFSRLELILTLGVVVSHEIFRRSIPVTLSEHRRIQQDLNRVKNLHRWQLVWDGIGGSTLTKSSRDLCPIPRKLFSALRATLSYDVW